MFIAKIAKNFTKYSVNESGFSAAFERAQPALRLSILFIFLICFLKRAFDLPLADEVDFVKPLEVWIHSGPQRWGMWHAPFYPWLLMLMTRQWGFSVGVERFLGCFTTLVSTALLYRASFLVRPDLSSSKRTVLLTFALIAPASLGSALLLDYDNTLLMMTTSIYLYQLVVYQSQHRRNEWVSYLMLGCSLGFCFMSKETTPLIFPIAILVACWHRLGLLRALGAALAVLIIGCIVFIIATKIWCDFYGLPFLGVFETDLLVLKLHATSRPIMPLVHLIWMKVVPLFWLGLPLSFLFLYRLRRIFRDPTLAAVGSLVVAVILAYTFVLNQRTFHFPKYMAPILPWLFWLIILSEDNQKMNPRAHKVSSLIWFASISAWFLLLPDPLQVLYRRDMGGLLQNISIIGIPFLAWLFINFLRKAPQFSSFVIMVSLGLCASYCRGALFGKYSITYWYGEQALSEARAEVMAWKQRHPDGLVIAPMKDLQWNTRDLGSVFYSKDELSGQSQHYCNLQQPLLIVTRIREEASLLRSPEFNVYRSCLRMTRVGKDIVVGSNGFE